MRERRPFLLPRTVGEIMTRDVVTISVDKTAEDVAKLMTKEGVGALVVIQGDVVVGIVTERDVITKIISKGLNPAKTRVGDFMTKPVITCSPETLITDAVKVMSANRVRRLPVLEEGKLIGIVTAYDIALYGWGIPSH